MALWKKIALGIAALMFLVVGWVAYFIHSLSDLCGNEILAESVSPNKAKKSVTFQRDCGATTGFSTSTQVSILAIDDTLENEGGNIFVANTNHGAAPSGKGGGPEIRLQWLSDTHLQVQYHPSARIFRSEAKANGVQVDYVAFR